MKRYLVFLCVLLLLVACAPSSQPAAAVPTAPTPVFEVVLPPDAIPALEAPPTVAAPEAAEHIGSDALVIGVALGGEARAYPIGLMSRYEVANDTLGGQPIAVTFCPLCNSGAVFARTVTPAGGASLELTFGVSGKLLDGALMMDRQTGSLWPQSRLLALEGALAGTTLDLLPANQMPWQEWAAGSYSVSWRTVSVDGHPLEGSYEFSVVAAGLPLGRLALLGGVLLAGGVAAAWYQRARRVARPASGVQVPG